MNKYMKVTFNIKSKDGRRAQGEGRERAVECQAVRMG